LPRRLPRAERHGGRLSRPEDRQVHGAVDRLYAGSDPGLHHPSRRQDQDGREHGKTLIRHGMKIAAAIGLLALTACGPDEPASSGGPPSVRRMTEAQYRQTIADIFGP